MARLGPKSERKDRGRSSRAFFYDGLGLRRDPSTMIQREPARRNHTVKVETQEQVLPRVKITTTPIDVAIDEIGKFLQDFGRQL
jgi:hypothetical protein